MLEVSPLFKKHPRRIISIIAVAAGCCALVIAVRASRHDLLVTFLDVGQGDAVLITAPNGNRLLYDAGPPTRAVLAALSKELSYFDHRIAFMVASHPDADHIGSFVDVLSRYTPALYLDGHTASASGDFIALEKYLAAQHIERRTLMSGVRISMGSGVYADVLSPTQGADKESLTANDASVVLLVHYGSSTVLLTGDLESVGEQRLVARFGTALHATILKAGHHGSKSSTSDALLQAAQPTYIAISVGKNNRYGHPHQAALARMQASGAIVVQTSLVGNIHFVCSVNMCTETE